MAVDRTFAGVNRDRPSGAKAARDSRSGMLRPVFRAAVREDLSAAGVAIATAADASAQRDLLELGTAAVSDAADFEVVANRGAISGYAELNSDGVIPAAQMGGATATTSTIIENRTSDPGAPEDGRIWLRTDL